MLSKNMALDVVSVEERVAVLVEKMEKEDNEEGEKRKKVKERTEKEGEHLFMYTANTYVTTTLLYK